MRASYARLFAPAFVGRRAEPAAPRAAAPISRWRASGRWRSRALNGAAARRRSPSRTPTRSRRRASASPCATRPSSSSAGRRRETRRSSRSRRRSSRPARAPAFAAGTGEYAGPLAYRQGKPMRPDVALAFDRLAAAAARDGVSLIVVSGFRSNAEQARLFAAHPDPRWVAPPGKSLHRLGTELDLGPASAYGWLAAHAPGLPLRPDATRGSRGIWVHARTPARPRSASAATATGAARCRRSCPPRFAPALARGGAALERLRGAARGAAATPSPASTRSRCRSAGAQGIAQFMPGTARALRPRRPVRRRRRRSTRRRRLMRDLLRQFGSRPARARRLQRRPRRRRRVRLHPAVPRDAGLRHAHPRPAARRRRRRRPRDRPRRAARQMIARSTSWACCCPCRR